MPLAGGGEMDAVTATPSQFEQRTTFSESSGSPCLCMGFAAFVLALLCAILAPGCCAVAEPDPLADPRPNLRTAPDALDEAMPYWYSAPPRVLPYRFPGEEPERWYPAREGEC